MPRLFTGLEVPPDVAMRLSLIQGGLPGARWIDPANFHITLAFIGDVENRTAREIADALTRISRPAFSIEVAGLGSFGTRKPSSVYASISENETLAALAASHYGVLRRLGVSYDARRFRPHITLGRVKQAKPADIARFLTQQGDLRFAPFPVGRFVLYSARDSVGGGPYVIEEAYPLGGEPVHVGAFQEPEPAFV